MRPLPGSLVASLERGGRGLSLLVVRLGAMGDILRTLPAVLAVRAGLPDATIHWVLDDGWEILLRNQSGLDGLVGFPRREWRGSSSLPWGWPRKLRAASTLRQRMRALSPDLAMDFHGNLRSGATTRLSGAPVRLGYVGHQAKEGNRWFTTHHVPSGDRRTPRMERNLDLVRALGVSDALPRIGPLAMARTGLDEAGRIVASFSPDGGAIAVLSPGASERQAYKRPPVNLLVAACRSLDSLGVAPLVVHGPGEEHDARRVVEASNGTARLAPPTSLPVLAALTAQARLFVGGDTGPLHLACAAGCPVVGLYGPTDPGVNQPWGVPYRALAPPDRVYTGIKREDRRKGFEGLSEALVEQAVRELLD